MDGAHPLGADLGPQRLDVAVDRAGRAGAAVPAPDLGQQALAGEHLAGRRGQGAQQVELRRASGAPRRSSSQARRAPGVEPEPPSRPRPAVRRPPPGRAARPARPGAAARRPGRPARASGTAWSGSRRRPPRARRARRPRRRARSASARGPGGVCWIRRQTSSPSKPGSITSSTTRSGWCSSYAATAPGPSYAETTLVALGTEPVADRLVDQRLVLDHEHRRRGVEGPCQELGPAGRERARREGCVQVRGRAGRRQAG